MNKFITIIIICFFIVFDAFSQNGNSSLTIKGRWLIDSCGEEILLRGINHGNVWSVNLGIKEFSEIAKTHANCVRICLERKYVADYDDFGEPVYDDLRSGQIDTVVQAALDLKLIPIVELHDFTDTSHHSIKENLDSAIMFWTQPSVMAVLKKHSQFLILNIANEPEHWENTYQEFYTACASAIVTLRAAGLKVPIMLDAMHWGQDEAFFMSDRNGENLLAIDPEHKLLFSVHTYWLKKYVSDTEMKNRFLAMYNSNLPFVIGEFAYDLGEECTNTISYHLIMDLCQQYRIGYLYWWWGFYEPNSNNCLSMTTTGTYAGLNNQGLEVAVTYVNSIQNTSFKPHLLTFGSCATDIEEYNQGIATSLFPNPSFGTFSINTFWDILNVKLIDMLGNELILNKIDETSFSFNSNCAGTYFVIVTFSNGKKELIKLIVL